MKASEISKSLAFLVLLALAAICFIIASCSSYNPNLFAERAKFVKTADKRKVTVGEAIWITLAVENDSGYNVESFLLKKELDGSGFFPVGSDYLLGGSLLSGKKKKFSYAVIAGSPGRKVIGPSKITKIKIYHEDKELDVPINIGFSNPVEISVAPLPLRISHLIKKRKIRLGGKIEAKVIVRNDSAVNIEDMYIAFEPSSLKLDLPYQTKRRVIPGGKTRAFGYELLAAEAGEASLGRLVIKRIQVRDTWIYCEEGYGSSELGPSVTVKPVFLPGMELPLTTLTDELANYFKPVFMLRVLSIGFGLILLIFLFSLAVRSFIVDFFLGRIVLTVIMATALSLASIFFISGAAWFWRTITPPLWMILAITAGSSVITLAFGLIPLRNYVLAALAFGLPLAFVSYVLYIGYMAFAYRDFSGFPVGLAVEIAISLAFTLSVLRLRRIIRRKHA